MHISTNEGIRVFNKHHELLGLYPGWGLAAWIEFPSLGGVSGTIHFTFIWGKVYIHFPWYKGYKDHGQASGPQFGFRVFTEDMSLWLMYGNDDGTHKGSRTKTIYGPWNWTFVRLEKTEVKGSYYYMYTRKSGAEQNAGVKLSIEERWWKRWWFPRTKYVKCLWCEFDKELGEKVGTWKGGVVGAGIDMLPGEHILTALVRMQRTRKFE